MTASRKPVSRRGLFARPFGEGEPAHVSSAVVTAFPERCDGIIRAIRAMPLTEVRHVEGGKIIVLLEGADSGEIGERLLAISAIEGVLSAAMVYEQQIDADGASS